MKQFIKTKKVTYNLMSFTGFKALILFSQLADGPKTYKEICDIFYNHPYLREKISIDTLRVYINSLRRIGCEIKRFRDEDKVSRYVITSHPFELSFTPEQLKSITKIYKNLVKNISIDELISIHEFLEKTGRYIKNEDFINEVKKVSMVKDINIDILKQLHECCNKKDEVVVSYQSPNSGLKNIGIITDKIDISNNKIYLYGLGLEYNEYTCFPLNRIKKINEIKVNKSKPVDLKELKVVYELYNTDFNAGDNDTIIEKNADKIVIETLVSNTFLFKQKLLEYGPKCKILAPEDFKNDFIQLLIDMKAGYCCD